jgi:Mrp family chromosome partitioning ATPase
MISAACDGTVLIVARNRTRHREARAALAKLRSSGARKVLGAVVNRRELRLRPSAYQNELSSPVYLGGEGVTMIPGHQ